MSDILQKLFKVELLKWFVEVSSLTVLYGSDRVKMGLSGLEILLQVLGGGAWDCERHQKMMYDPNKPVIRRVLPHYDILRFGRWSLTEGNL